GSEVDEHHPRQRREEEQSQLCAWPRVKPAGQATRTARLDGRNARCSRGAHQLKPNGSMLPGDGSSGSIVVTKRSARSRSAERGPGVDPILLRDARRGVVFVRAVLLWRGPVMDAVEV